MRRSLHFSSALRGGKEETFLSFGIVKEVYIKALELITLRFDFLVYLLDLLQNIPGKLAQICFSPAHFPPHDTNN